MQDIAFTICYLVFGLRGYWSDTISNREYDIPHPGRMTDWIHNATTTGSLLFGGSNIDNAAGTSFIQTADAYVPSMERSWIVHTAILPACMISPLWWRFLQTIRQSYESQKRWPYLGNSFKYFLAAQVAMLGVYHPSVRHSTLWICSFVIATVYQVNHVPSVFCCCNVTLRWANKLLTHVSSLHLS
jgi:EXS family